MLKSMLNDHEEWETLIFLADISSELCDLKGKEKYALNTWRRHSQRNNRGHCILVSEKKIAQFSRKISVRSQFCWESWESQLHRCVSHFLRRKFCENENLPYRKNYWSILTVDVRYSCIILVFRKKLFVGTVPTNKKLFVGTIPTNKKLSVGTVPTNKKLFVGTVRPFK